MSASGELPLRLQKVVTVRLVKNRPINLWSTLGAVFIFSFNIASAQSITITEFALPRATFPYSITPGPDAALWFTESDCPANLVCSGKIGRITTAGAVTEYPLADGPNFITAGPDGALWYTENPGASIGRITTSGVITEYPVPTFRGVSGSGITAGPDGALWFPLYFENMIGRITTAGVFTEYAVPTAFSGPIGIATGPDGALWFVESGYAQGVGQGVGKIGRVTTAGVITEYPLPTANSYPTGITPGPDGALWFTEDSGNKIGRITTAGVITEYPLPTAGSGPQGITAGPDGALWFTEPGSAKIGRITTAGVITEYPLPTAGSAPWGITAGPDGAVWFTELGSAKIGRAAVSPVSPFTTYTYHGNPYNVCGGTYCTGGPYALSVDFTAASAPANLPYTVITSSIVSFAFTDGSGLTNNSNHSFYRDFNISTDASGNIATWFITSCGDSSCNIQMQTNWHSPVSFIPGQDFSETTANLAGSYGLINANPGNWSASPVAAFSATQVAMTASGLLYSRVTRTYNGSVTITNISGGVLGGPFPIVFTSLTPGVTLTNATGTVQGGPYINPVVSSLAPGQSITVPVQFSNPSNALINFTPVVY
jgi:streptogramin lyase